MEFVFSWLFLGWVCTFGVGFCWLLLGDIPLGAAGFLLRPKASPWATTKNGNWKAEPWRLSGCLLRPTSWMAYYRCECQKSGIRQLRLVVYPVIYKAFYIPGGAGFLPSTVWPNQIFRRQVHHSPWSPSYAVICTLSNRERKIQEKSITHVIQKMYSETCSSNWRGEINRNLWNPKKPENQKKHGPFEFDTSGFLIPSMSS